jgi:hypothetical protein
MNTKRNTFAYILIAFGAIALLSRFSGDTGWLWVALVSGGFLFAYSRERRYGFLVVGAILAGIAGGIMVEELWGWEGGFLLSLGLGFAAIDRVEPRSNRWPFYLGVMLIGLGLLTGLTESNLFGSFWFSLLLIGGGIYLLNRARERGARRPATPSAPQATAETAPVPAPVDTPPAPSGTEVRLAALEAWRDAQAEAEGRAPYLIATDETLAELAENNPTDLDGVRRVKGIGPVKLERYGESLLEVLHDD